MLSQLPGQTSASKESTQLQAVLETEVRKGDGPKPTGAHDRSAPDDEAAEVFSLPLSTINLRAIRGCRSK
jgi:hypothetical protein